MLLLLPRHHLAIKAGAALPRSLSRLRPRRNFRSLSRLRPRRNFPCQAWGFGWPASLGIQRRSMQSLGVRCCALETADAGCRGVACRGAALDDGRCSSLAVGWRLSCVVRTLHAARLLPGRPSPSPPRTRPLWPRGGGFDQPHEEHKGEYKNPQDLVV